MTNNELINFHHEMFGDIRAIEIKNEVWFVGADVATALGYTNPRKALGDHVDDEDKNTVTIRDGIQGNPKQDHHQRVGSLLPRPLLQVPAGKGLQALGHRRGAALHPPSRSLCYGTDDREDYRLAGVRDRALVESLAGAAPAGEAEQVPDAAEMPSAAGIRQTVMAQRCTFMLLQTQPGSNRQKNVSTRQRQSMTTT